MTEKRADGGDAVQYNSTNVTDDARWQHVAELLASPPGCEDVGCDRPAELDVHRKDGKCLPLCREHGLARLARAAEWDVYDLVTGEVDRG